MSKTTILAIDPGSTESAWLMFRPSDMNIGDFDIASNEELVNFLITGNIGTPHVAIEWVESYGMPVGADVFETVYWIGRFREAFGSDIIRVPRKAVKMHLCQSMRAKEANIRQALLDRFPADGGGKTPQIGTKARPGPLYGIKSHLWSALAVAVTAAGMLESEAQT